MAIETFLSETCWEVLEHARVEDRDADADCAMMADPVENLLQTAGLAP